jgi:hypothetical protein
MTEVPVTLEAVGVKSYSELYALPTVEVIRKLDAKRNAGRDVPLHEGDGSIARATIGAGQASR